MLLRAGLLVLLTLGVVACSSNDGTDQPEQRTGDIRGNDTWKDGLKLTGVVRIFEAATVEIEPGAKITCTDGVEIQVGGTLRVKATAKHARITCGAWSGIVVAQNGKLDIEGLDIENPRIGVATTLGAGEAAMTDSSIISALHPFRVGAGSKLTLKNVKATTPTQVPPTDQSVSEIFGSLVASRLDYDASTNEGIMLKEGGEAVIEDSTLTATNGMDLVSAYGAKSLALRYSTLRGAHCGPHIQGIDSFEIDHVTSEGNIYGITIYKAGTGPNLVKASNLIGSGAWLDLQGDHGPITFDNVFVQGAEQILNTDPPAALSKATTRIEGAQPR